MSEKQLSVLKNNTQIPFDSISQFDLNQDYLKLIRQTLTGIKEGKDDENQINNINELRRLRKYHSELFLASFSHILPYFINNLMKSSKLEICCNALTLVSEIFSYYFETGINSWIPDLLPITIQLSSSNFGLIWKQSYYALNNLANNMYYQETLYTLLEIVTENDEVQSENACETLVIFFSTINKYVLLYNFLWFDACEYIFKMLQSGNYGIIEKAKFLLYLLKMKFDSDYNIFVSFFESDDQRKFVEECMIGYQNDKKCTKFETFLKQNA
jgi:hypothetical protein